MATSRLPDCQTCKTTPCTRRERAEGSSGGESVGVFLLRFASAFSRSVCRAHLTGSRATVSRALMPVDPGIRCPVRISRIRTKCEHLGGFRVRNLPVVRAQADMTRGGRRYFVASSSAFFVSRAASSMASPAFSAGPFSSQAVRVSGETPTSPTINADRKIGELNFIGAVFLQGGNYPEYSIQE